ncbi:CoA-binding protein [Aestuariivirga litoralis]|uniref:CoA-binding protein n=1 Tax=Aestuariivirga litoralis TaxID=2650924 RepID=A0A2W2BPK7_9HYPH|nr:acetate--CoA ligase family protein [Aestuariivirga litoralis]PZF75346.1 CoA-binding protein [Aestuariivirga litoralis]
MTPKARANLDRLLRPRHVAVIGGRDAETVAAECKRIGFAGPFWPVNPKRSQVGGHACFASVEDLPEAPDAVFLAVPKEAAIEALHKLSAMGAGGVVCYTAGFGETGAEGADAEARLVQAAGNLALVGPNCYGVINYVDRVALWPFTHGGACPGHGAAIITQSGMLSSDFTMSQRGVPFAYMVSAGNQTLLRLEDFVDALCERPEVRAIGLHIEGLKDVAAFERAALKSLSLGKPIVALKTGTSRLGSSLTVSHTGSLSGTEELYDALFDRLGIIRADSPAQLLETVKFLCVAGVPKGRRLAGLTCSGGGATMLADYAERLDLSFTPPDAATAASLRVLLPQTATVSNPLDYTTPIWGIPEKTRPVFDTLFAQGHDAAVIVQDYPAPGLDESKPWYRNDTLSFIAAAKARALPAAVCSTIPENLDEETRSFLVAQGVAPMQGIEQCMAAIAAAAWHGERRAEIAASPTAPLLPQQPAGDVRLIDEAAAKTLLAAKGIAVPHSRIGSGAEIAALSRELGYPVALKMVSEKLPHKTEAGAVRLGLRSAEDVTAAVQRMRADVAAYNPAALTDVFLVEAMVAQPVAELMVSIRRDPQFGLAMTLAAGGILVELLADAVTVLLPASRADLARALSRLKISRLLAGYRGRPAANREALLDTLERLAAFAADPANEVAEIEINPLFAGVHETCAVDVLMQRLSA